jgi:hypothetical protein
MFYLKVFGVYYWVAHMLVEVGEKSMEWCVFLKINAFSDVTEI